MSDPKRPGGPWSPEDIAEEEFGAEEDTDGDVDVDYRRRGRPKLPPELKRRAKLIVSFTGDEKTALIIAAAETKDHKNRPLSVQEWARQVLLEAARKK